MSMHRQQRVVPVRGGARSARPRTGAARDAGAPGKGFGCLSGRKPGPQRGAVCPPIAGDLPPRIFEVRKSWGVGL